MSEEEKNAIEYFKRRIANKKTAYTSIYFKIEKLELLLNLIEKQQKEIEEYTKFKKDIVNRIMMWDKKKLPDNEIIISVLDTFVAEVSRLEDIEDRKIQVEVKFIEEKRDKYWKKKIKAKIKALEKEEDKVKMMPFEIVEETHRRVE